MNASSPVQDHVDTLYAAALWLLQEERPADALHLFRMMLLLVPTDERGWLGLGTAHEQLDQESIALVIFAEATKAAPAPRCSLARARLLRKLGRDEEAETAIDEADDAATKTNDDEAADLAARMRRAA